MTVNNDPRRFSVRGRNDQREPTRSGSFVNNSSINSNSPRRAINPNAPRGAMNPNAPRRAINPNAPRGEAVGVSNMSRGRNAGNRPVSKNYINNPATNAGGGVNYNNRNVVNTNVYNPGANNFGFGNYNPENKTLEELMKEQEQVANEEEKAKYALDNVSSSKYSLSKVESYLSEKDRDILSASKAKKIIADAELMEKSISEQTRQDGNLYIEIVGTLNQGSSILSFKLKVVGMIVFAIMLAIVLFGYYLNTSNPLIPVIEASKKPFAINIVDKNNVKIYSAVNMKDSLTDRLSPYLTDSLLALHGALEYEYQSRTGNDKAVQANEGGDEQSSTVSEGVGKIKGLFEENACIIYTNLSQFNSYNCRYSYPNFLINDFLRDISDNNLVSKLINFSSLLRNYLLVSWIEGNVNEQGFLNIYFNYVSYGKTYLGLDAAAKGYFDAEVKDLTLPQAVYLMNVVYNNNKNLYPSYDSIGVSNIIDQLVINNVISSSDKKMLIDEVNAIQPVSDNGVFSIYLENMYSQAENYNLKVPSATVYSTFVSTLQNAAVSMLEGSMKNFKIPHGSVVILNNNEIVAGTTFSIEAGERLNSFERNYYKVYPEVKSYNSVKPFLYYALLKNNIDIPKLLLDAKYQNLLFSEHRLKRKDYLEELDKKLLASNQEIPRRSAEAIGPITNNKELDSAPEDMRLLFANKLSNMEFDLLNEITPEQYQKVLQKIFINADMSSVSDIVDGKVAMNFMDLVKAYSALSVGGAFYSLDYISAINNNYYIDNFYAFNNIESQYVRIINNIFFNTFVPRDRKTVFRYIVDTNTLFAFSGNYVIGLWLGDLDNIDLAEDYSSVLLSVFKDLSSVIPGV